MPNDIMAAVRFYIVQLLAEQIATDIATNGLTEADKDVVKKTLEQGDGATP